MIKGNLPKNLTYYIKPKRKVRFRWDDLEKTTEVGEVSSVFVSDAENQKTKDTGAKWAAANVWDEEKKTYVAVNPIAPVEKPNIPFQIKILNLEYRGNGGRAYKCIDDNSYYFDLREDVLLDVIRNCKIVKGKPDCHFVWGKVGSEMKLVRVGSELHDSLLEGNKYKELKPVKISDIKIGDVFADKRGGQFVFLGWCETIVAESFENNQDFRNRETRITALNTVKYMCWYMVPYYNKDKNIDIKDKFESLKSSSTGHYTNPCWSIKFTKSCSYKQKVATVKVPDNIFELIRDRMGDYAEVTKHKGKILKSNLQYYYECLNVRPAGSLPVQIPDAYRLRVGDNLRE